MSDGALLSRDEFVERLRVGQENQSEVLLAPLTECVEERLFRREVPVDGPHRHTRAHRNQRNCDLLDVLVCEHICQRLQNPKARLLQLFSAERALVGTRCAHVTITIIQVTLTCQENTEACRELWAE